MQKKDGSLKRFLKSGETARLTTIEIPSNPVLGIQTIRRSLGDTIGLPQETEDTVFLVSSFVLQANKDRKDLLSPDTGPTAIRDDRGQIVAVTRFVTN